MPVDVGTSGVTGEGAGSAAGTVASVALGDDGRGPGASTAGTGGLVVSTVVGGGEVGAVWAGAGVVVEADVESVAGVSVAAGAVCASGPADPSLLGGGVALLASSGMVSFQPVQIRSGLAMMARLSS